MKGVQFEGNEVGFQAAIGPRRMFFFLFFLQNRGCKVRVGVGAYLCILMMGMSVREMEGGKERFVRESGMGSETGEREKTAKKE